MADLEGGTTVWIVYLCALFLFLLIAWWVLHRNVNRRLLNLLLLVTAIVLATPFGVPDAASLAPAWLVATFEFLFGEKTIAFAALQAIAVLLGSFFVAFVVVFLLRKKAKRSSI